MATNEQHERAANEMLFDNAENCGSWFQIRKSKRRLANPEHLFDMVTKSEFCLPT